MNPTAPTLPPEYRQELRASAISDELINYLAENNYFYELAGNYEVAQFLNRSFARFGWKAIKQQSRGWVFRGLDPQSWGQMSWGCFKPDQPRPDFSKPGKLIKYDAPVGSKKRVFVVPSPAFNWQSDYSDRSVTKILAEGFKKTASLVDHGHRAIGLDGIWCGVRKTKTGALQLIPDLELAATPGTTFVILFDHDTKPSTVRDVQRATVALGRELEKRQCSVKVALLPGPEKGVDDFLAARGAEALDAVLAAAVELQTYADQCWDSALHHMSRTPHQVVDQRFLNVTIPDSGLVVIESAMGTGKTELLRSVCAQTPSVLSLTHRVTLGRQAAARLGLALYSEANIERAGKLEITIDSLYKLPTYQNAYHTVIIDEVEQVISHMLDSSTCKEQRVAILQKFAYFIQRAERVILQQAEVSDAVVDYVAALRGDERPYIICNDYKPESRLIGWYNQNNPSALLGDLQKSLANGERCLIPCYSKTRAKSLEELLSAQFPNKKIRVIHGDNSGDPESIAFIENINEQALGLDALIFTPSMSTGVSIDVQAFDSVWGIFDTCEIHASELLQMLGRYRPMVPWMVWSARRGAGYAGSTKPDELIQKELESNRRTGILTSIDPLSGVESGPHLECWAKIKARFYSSKVRQREVLRKLLSREGHYLFEIEGDSQTDVLEQLKAAKLKVRQAEAEAISAASDLSESEAEALSFRAERLTEAERHQLEKHRLKSGYHCTVTPELVLKDDSGRLLKAIFALEELLEPEVALERDLKDLQRFKFLPDRRHRTLKRAYRDKLGLRAFLDPDREWQRDDLAELEDQISSCRDDVKSVLNLTIPENFSPCWVVAQLLQQLGIKLTSRREGGRGSQTRLYRLDPAHWQVISEILERRRQARATSGSHPPLYESNTPRSDYAEEHDQLSISDL